MILMMSKLFKIARTCAGEDSCAPMQQVTLLLLTNNVLSSCSDKEECVSFAYEASGTLRCRLSKTVDRVIQTNLVYPNWDFFLKKDEVCVCTFHNLACCFAF